MSYQVINPFIQFVDPINGRPLTTGEVYFGRMDSDPKNQPANRINVYAVQDNGSEVLLSQPIQLNGAGQPSVDGSVKQIKVELYAGESAYAVQIFNRGGAQKGYSPRVYSMLDLVSLAATDSTVIIAGFQARQLRLINGIKNLVAAEGVSMLVNGFYENSTVGGGDFYYSASTSKALHNGGTVISPESLLLWDGTQANVSALLGWTGSGSGCFVRVNSGESFDPTWFGAVISSTIDSTASIKKCVNIATRVIAGTARFPVYAVKFPEGEFLVTENNWLGTSIYENSIGSLINFRITGAGRKNSIIRFKPPANAIMYDQSVVGTPALLGLQMDNISVVFDSSAGASTIDGFKLAAVSGKASQLLEFKDMFNYLLNTSTWLNYTGSVNEDNTIISDCVFTNIKTLIQSTNTESVGHYVRNVYISTLSGDLFVFVRGGCLTVDGGNVTFNSASTDECALLYAGYGTASGDSSNFIVIRGVRCELRQSKARALRIDRQFYGNISFESCSFSQGSYQGQAIAVIPIEHKSKLTFKNCMFPEQSNASVTRGKIQFIDGRSDADASQENRSVSEVLFDGATLNNIRTPAFTSYSMCDYTALTAGSVGFRSSQVIYRNCDAVPDGVEYGESQRAGRTFRSLPATAMPFRGLSFPIGNGSVAVNASGDFNLIVPINNFVGSVSISRASIASFGGVSYSIQIIDGVEYASAGSGVVYGTTTAQAGNLAINQTVHINKLFDDTLSLAQRTLYLRVATGFAVTDAGNYTKGGVTALLY